MQFGPEARQDLSEIFTRFFSERDESYHRFIHLILLIQSIRSLDSIRIVWYHYIHTNLNISIQPTLPTKRDSVIILSFLSVDALPICLWCTTKIADLEIIVFANEVTINMASLTSPTFVNKSLRSSVVVLPYFMMNQSNMCRNTVFGCFMQIGSYVSRIALGRFARKKNIGESGFHGDDVGSCFAIARVGGLQRLTLVVRGASGEIWDCINFVRERKVSWRICLSHEERIETWWRGTEQHVHCGGGRCFLCLQTSAGMEHQVD